MNAPVWMWVVFISVVACLLIMDLGILHKKNRIISATKSIAASGLYLLAALLFGGWIFYTMGDTSAEEYLTGFLVEYSLSLDNIFIMSLIFTSFSIPQKYQHRVLFWGVMGVLVMRGIMIGLGATLIAEFRWTLYVFAVLLIVTGIKMLWVIDKKLELDKSRLLIFMRKYLPITQGLHGDRFFVTKPDETGKSKLWCTPLFIVLILIEFFDLIFAVDSVPAIFSIATDPFIVYTCNIFAVLGLRSLYSALAAIIHRFVYLKYAFALILIFIGSKAFIAYFLHLEKFPVTISLGVTLSLLVGGVLFSLHKTKSIA